MVSENIFCLYGCLALGNSESFITAPPPTSRKVLWESHLVTIRSMHRTGGALRPVEILTSTLRKPFSCVSV